MLNNKIAITEKIAVVDIETTGLSSKLHEVIEIGCILFQQTRTGGNIDDIKIIEEWESKLKPERPETADPVALKINGYSEEGWSKALKQYDGLQQFSKKVTELSPNPFDENQLINNIIILGHNITFDLRMLESAYLRYDINHPTNKRSLDTYSIARGVFREDKTQTNFSLPALCSRFNIVNKNAHTALSDCHATLELYKRLMGVS